MHLRVDCLGHVGNKTLLLDPKQLKEALCELAEIAKMHAFGEPQVMECPFPYPEGGIALSAVLFLGESAITVHTWPEKKTVWLDIFHCFPFDVEEVFEWIADTFQMDREAIHTDLYERGIDEQGNPVETRPLAMSKFAYAGLIANAR